MTRIVALGAMLLLAGTVAISAAEKTKTAMGKVTAVSGDSLSIMSGSQAMIFAVDATTKVLGKGLGTMANEKKAKHEPFTITYTHRTLTGWFDAVLAAGLSIEAIAEPHADEDTARDHPEVADSRVAPYFLILRGRKPRPN